MEENEDYKRVYTGPTVIIKMLQSHLEDVDIYPIVKDNLSSGTWGGFGGVPGMIQLFVHRDEYDKAEKIVGEVLKNMESE